MTDTKRVDELEVGDIVIPNGCKGVLTVSRLEKITSTVYSVKFEGMEEISFLDYCEKLTYLGNDKKEEEIMTTQKIDCSVLYHYFDSLANEEDTFKHTNVPVYVKQQLKYIHELFEDVLELTLEEVKTLYFERKMSKEDPEVEKVTETKKAGELKIGDVIIFPDSEESKTVYSIRKRKDGLVLDISFLEKENVYNVGREVRVAYLFNDLEAVYRRTRQLRTKKVSELEVGDKVILPIYNKKRVLTIKRISSFNTFQNLLSFNECTQEEVYNRDKVVGLDYI